MTRRKQLQAHSIAVILANQDESGAYIACPSFDNYKYSWFRDGSFIAYSMLVSGQAESCRRFLEWGHRVVLKNSASIRRIVRIIRDGETPAEGDYLPTRFTLAGNRVGDDWPNHQIDGYGCWLWCLGRYIRITGGNELLHEFAGSIRLILDYLGTLWDRPNFDIWEENGDGIHPATLACVFGGIREINYYLSELELQQLSEKIRNHVMDNGTHEGRFVKGDGKKQVDANLLWLAVPFAMVDIDDPRMRKTVQEIEANLLTADGGVRRYATDTYYGGGEWLLLTCWLAWYQLAAGRSDKARSLMAWVASKADKAGDMPEQVSANIPYPEYLPYWEARWGQSAKPLLWSHAMYLTVLDQMERA